MAPSWIGGEEKANQELTALNVAAYCDQWRPTKGMLIVDDVTFVR